MVVAKPKSGALVSLFSSSSLYWIKTVIKVFSTGCRKASSMDWKTSFGGWGGGEELTKSGPGDDVLTTTHMLVSGIFKQLNDFRRCSWCCDQIFEDRECFLLQMKCMLSASVEIISYWAWLKISVWENEPKLKEATINHFALRHYWWIEVYTCSEQSVKQYARIV